MRVVEREARASLRGGVVVVDDMRAFGGACGGSRRKRKSFLVLARAWTEPLWQVNRSQKVEGLLVCRGHHILLISWKIRLRFAVVVLPSMLFSPSPPKPKLS